MRPTRQNRTRSRRPRRRKRRVPELARGPFVWEGLKPVQDVEGQLKLFRED
jgi:hypothetical protein